MTVQLSKAQIEALKVELGKYGLEVKKAPKPRKPKTGFLAHSKWYRPPSLANLRKPYPKDMKFVETSFRFIDGRYVPIGQDVVYIGNKKYTQ